MQDQGKVTITRNGKDYKGTYKMTGNGENALVTVSSAIGEKSVERGGMPIETLARLLLRELAEDSIRKS